MVEYKEINGNGYFSEDGWKTCQAVFNLNNGSTITPLSSKNTIRSRPHIYELIDLSEYHWWQRLYLRWLDSNLARRMNRKKRR